MKPLLIIVSGPPGVGKTTLARRIGEKYHFPVLARDGLKETLFDALGYSDRAWSKRLGKASYHLLDHVLETLLSAGRSVIVESNFKPELDSEKFSNLQNQHGFHAVQILCHADAELITTRFKKRVERGDRHPGHADQDNFEEHMEIIRTWNHEPLKIQGDVYKIDMNAFEKINMHDLFFAIEAHLNA